ncbi:MAG: hypothetical protein ABI193_24065 [Minicystis sp.]
MTRIVKETIAHLEKGLAPDSKLKGKLETIYKNKDPRALQAIKKDLLDEFSGTFQASPAAKGGALVLQLVSFFMAYAAYKKDSQDSNRPGGNADKGVVMVDCLNLAGQGGMLLIGSFDLIASSFGAFQSSARTIGVWGMRLGVFASALGLMASFSQLSLATDALSTVNALSGVGGNTLTLLASACWLAGVPLPGVQTVGMVLLCIGGVIGLGQAVLDASKPRTNMLAGAVLDAIEASPWCTALCANPAVAAEMKALRDGLDGAVLPSPQRNSFVIDALRNAGFMSTHIDMIVQATGATILPEGTLGQWSP